MAYNGRLLCKRDYFPTGNTTIPETTLDSFGKGEFNCSEEYKACSYQLIVTLEWKVINKYICYGLQK